MSPHRSTGALGGSAPPPFVGGVLPQAPGPTTAVPQAPATTPVANVVSRGFQYPAVFLFPLLLAIGAGYLGRALTRDLTLQLELIHRGRQLSQHVGVRLDAQARSGRDPHVAVLEHERLRS